MSRKFLRPGLMLWLWLLCCASLAQGNSSTLSGAMSGSVSPQVALINTNVTFKFITTLANPPQTSQEGQQIGDPVVNWGYTLQYKPTQASSFDKPLDGTYANVSTTNAGLNGAAVYKFFIAGYWQVTASTPVSYSDNLNPPNTWATSAPITGIAGTHTSVTIDISYNNGAVITNQTQNIIVGQTVGLTGSPAPKDAVTSVKWDISGKYLKQWKGDNLKSTATLVSAAELASNAVSFFWCDGNSKAVKYTVKIAGAGQDFTASTTFNVLRPGHTINAKVTGTVGADTNYAGNLQVVTTPYLHFGTGGIPLNPVPGITFGVKLDSGWIFGGDTQWIQIASPNRQVITSDNVTHTYTGTGLDTFYPYPPDSEGGATSDSPGQPLLGVGDIVADSFQMWLMYRPLGGNWVPLRIASWSWGGSGIPNFTAGSNGWSLAGPYATLTPEADTTTYPVWTSNSASDVFTPKL